MSIEALTAFIETNGVWIIFIMVAMEYAGIPGYPGGLILPVIGIMSRMKLINPLVGFVIAIISSSIMMAMVYAVSLKCGNWVSKKLVNEEKFSNSYAYMKTLIAKYGCPAVFIARIIPVVRAFVSMTAGLLGMEWRRYIIYSFWGNMVYVAAAIALGYFATAIFI